MNNKLSSRGDPELLLRHGRGANPQNPTATSKTKPAQGSFPEQKPPPELPGAAGIGTEGPPSSGIRVLQDPAGISVPHGAGNGHEEPGEAGNTNGGTIPAPSRLPLPCPAPPCPPADPAPRSQPGQGPSEARGGQGGAASRGCPGKGWLVTGRSQVDVGDVRGGAGGLAAPVGRRLGAEFLLGLRCLLQALG